MDHPRVEPASPGFAAKTSVTVYALIECEPRLERRIRYVLDTLFLAAGFDHEYVTTPPAREPWIHYAVGATTRAPARGCVQIEHAPAAWQFERETMVEDLSLAAPPAAPGHPRRIAFDVLAAAFFFLAAVYERSRGRGAGRATFTNSVFAAHGLPQDSVDRYLETLVAAIRSAANDIGREIVPTPAWPVGKEYAVVLSHDVDFLPERPVVDNAVQGVRTLLRHLVKQRDFASAAGAAMGFVRAVAAGRDPYGCVPAILAEERARGVRASYQVAVAHRHPNDVNYHVENPRTAEYLRVLCGPDADLCLHGSVRSTENPDWYVEEVETLARHLARPLGSRQHYLSFDYDALFAAQERAGIQYDMSLGYPDQIGARSGFSYPFFPYNLREDRPYDVLQISLFLMDVTLQSYLGLRADRAREVARDCLDGVRRRGGCVSIVWHPIVFGGARDPGYDAVYWDLVDHVLATDGLATDGRTINDWWRARAARYASFRSPRADAAHFADEVA